MHHIEIDLAHFFSQQHFLFLFGMLLMRHSFPRLYARSGARQNMSNIIHIRKHHTFEPHPPITPSQKIHILSAQRCIETYTKLIAISLAGRFRPGELTLRQVNRARVQHTASSQHTWEFIYVWVCLCSNFYSHPAQARAVKFVSVHMAT